MVVIGTFFFFFFNAMLILFLQEKLGENVGMAFVKKDYALA